MNEKGKYGEFIGGLKMEQQYFEVMDEEKGFKVDVLVEWGVGGEEIFFQQPNTNFFCSRIEQVNFNWSYQDTETEKNFNEFLTIVSNIDAEWFANMKINQIIRYDEKIHIERTR